MSRFYKQWLQAPAEEVFEMNVLPLRNEDPETLEQKLKALLLQNPYKVDEDLQGGQKHGLHKWDDLKSMLDATDEELNTTLRRVSALEIDGHWRILEDMCIYQLLYFLVWVIDVNYWSYDSLDVNKVVEALGGGHHKYPHALVDHCFKLYASTTDGKVWQLDTKRVSMELARWILKDKNAKMEFQDFMTAWTCVGLPVSVDMLEGDIVVEHQSWVYLSSEHNALTSEFSHRQSLGRQLQQLFRLQDSGLDPYFIERLPVFEYKHVMGTKYSFDCVVCLCEFSPHDKLRLIPVCSHAFHTHCIDTWLLSNSTCPLCRVNLNTESALTDHNAPFEIKCVNVSTNSIERVFSVRLGKFKSLKGERSIEGEISRCNLDARRCFSMGSVQYVVDNVMQVTLFNVKDNVNCEKSEDNIDLRKIKYESVSVSKVWLWNKKGKFPVSSPETEVGGVSSSQNVI
ncbi:uncharacterized protein LOC143529893 [Bidens hawaiensis]|uniref:uncharacterized protein LOC143529893 n=1 Tax=Bidens hawaiensis TaxID=980011 RepID=UPI00404B9A12